jgi:hypothetical protein
VAEADTALRHMLTFNKWPHYFHQTNLAKYDASGNTLQFDWLNAVFAEYERVFKLPVKNYPYYLIGDQTEERLRDCRRDMGSHDQQGDFESKQNRPQSRRYRS